MVLKEEGPRDKCLQMRRPDQKDVSWSRNASCIVELLSLQLGVERSSSFRNAVQLCFQFWDADGDAGGNARDHHPPLHPHHRSALPRENPSHPRHRQHRKYKPAKGTCMQTRAQAWKERCCESAWGLNEAGVFRPKIFKTCIGYTVQHWLVLGFCPLNWSRDSALLNILRTNWWNKERFKGTPWKHQRWSGWNSYVVSG